MLSNINLNVERDTFEPGMFSIPELHFMLDHLEEPPIAVFSDDLPPGVMRVRAEFAMTRFYQLHELQQHRGTPWAGYESIKDSILRFLSWHERAEEIKKRSRGSIANASMFVWDGTGQPYKYAIGADSADLVRTEILHDGERQPFGVKLTLNPADVLKSDLSDIAPWIKKDGKLVAADKLIESTNKRMGKIECPVCGKVEEYDTAARQSKMNARARMAKHLKTAKVEVNRHRILYTKEFK